MCSLDDSLNQLLQCTFDRHSHIGLVILQYFSEMKKLKSLQTMIASSLLRSHPGQRRTWDGSVPSKAVKDSNGSNCIAPAPQNGLKHQVTVSPPTRRWCKSAAVFFLFASGGVPKTVQLTSGARIDLRHNFGQGDER